jgi:hypothetical protein
LRFETSHQKVFSDVKVHDVYCVGWYVRPTVPIFKEMNKTIYINHKKYGRIAVAEVVGDTMKKSIPKASWLMRVPPGIAFDDNSLIQAAAAGAKYVCAIYEGIRYWADIRAIRIPVDREHNFQRGLAWHEWAGSKAGADIEYAKIIARREKKEVEPEKQKELF